MRGSSYAVALGAVLVGAACAREPVIPRGTGLMRASIGGDVAAAYEGTGEFSVGEGRVPVRPAAFILRSVDVVNGGNGSLVLQRIGSALPAPGRYALGGTSAFRARFERLADGIIEGYTAESGAIEITRASPDSVVGTFRFEAGRNCTGTLHWTHCYATAPPEVPRIAVEGSFVAVRSANVATGVFGF